MSTESNVTLVGAESLKQVLDFEHGAFSPPGYNFTGDEDCLSLNIWAPPNATDLPVMVWIHGGGYGHDQITSGNLDLSAIINTNDKSFIGVEIQYRVSHS